MKVGGLVAGLVLVAGGARVVLVRNFWHSPDLRVAGADVQTTGSLTHDDILLHAGLSESDHVYDVDLEQARENLEALPVVRQASVERELPGRLVIRVEERLPVAWLACESPRIDALTTNANVGGCLLDTEGHIFRCTELRKELMNLPILHVRRLPNTQPGVQVTAEPVQAGLALLDRVRQHFGPRGMDVREIDSPNDWSLVVKFTDDTAVTFGYDDVEGQIDQLSRIFEVAVEKNLRLATVNLLARKNVAATILGPARPQAAPAAAPPTAPAAPAGGVPRPVGRPGGRPDRESQLHEILGPAH
jgi:hypothetical protein